jgi:predicted nucleic acid-binding protein
MRDAMAPGTRRLLCAVNYAEILIGPLKAGRQTVVAEMLERLAIGIVPVDAVLAQHAAAVRARTSVKLPDAFALATALHSGAEATLASFDERVLKTYAGLRPG